MPVNGDLANKKLPAGPHSKWWFKSGPMYWQHDNYNA
nr:MAG TPA_asm: hypothetical protein [Caudoviricetes sp.]